MEQISITNADSDDDQLSLDPASILDFEEDGKSSEEPLNNEPEYGLEPFRYDDGGWGELPGYYKDDDGGLEEPLQDGKSSEEPLNNEPEYCLEPSKYDDGGWGELPGYYKDDDGGLDEPSKYDDGGWGELPGYYKDDDGGLEEPLHEPYEDDGRRLDEIESYGYGYDDEPYEDDGKGWEELEPYESEPYRYDRGWEEPLYEPIYPPEQFNQDYLCLPISHIDKHHLEDGNKVIMPASALGRLMDMNINEYPMMFEINNYDKDRISHCGVLEFSAEEGFVHLPNWMMENMKFQEGDLVSLKNVLFGLPKGEYMKIQPHETKFVMNLKNPKEVLEAVLKDFTCVTAGDTIMINHEGQKYYVDIVETKPSNAISLFETDCEVDFATPLDYREPEKKPTTVIKWKNEKSAEKVEEKPEKEEPKFTAFTGVARRLDGDASLKEEKSVVVAEEGSDFATCEANATSRKHDRNLVFGSNNDAQKSAKKVTKVDNVQEKSPNAEEEKFKPFTGKKYTL